MGNKYANRELILVDIKDPIFLYLGVMLFTFFMLAEAPFDIPIADSLDRGDSIFQNVVSDFEVPDEILVLCVNSMYLAEMFTEMLG